MIAGLADRIRNTPAPQIDRDAYDLILHTIGTRPDALYILTQTVLIQEMALNQARTQIEELRSQAAPPPVSQQGGFLGSRAPVYGSSDYRGSEYASPPPPSGGGFSGFLHNAATTAAGVIAGELAFDSLSSLFGHRGGLFGGSGGLFGGGGGISPGAETIVNNYYGDERNPGSGNDGSRFAEAASQDQNISSDIDDERDNSGDGFFGGDGDDGGSSDV
ncbi:MAG: DUF2076 domain-containing protein [Acidobacteriota bacterium]|nr:DUF2076 domain-containing protein [Acidobacteriota bacterium]